MPGPQDPGYAESVQARYRGETLSRYKMGLFQNDSKQIDLLKYEYPYMTAAEKAQFTPEALEKEYLRLTEPEKDGNFITKFVRDFGDHGGLKFVVSAFLAWAGGQAISGIAGGGATTSASAAPSATGAGSATATQVGGVGAGATATELSAAEMLAMESGGISAGQSLSTIPQMPPAVIDIGANTVTTSNSNWFQSTLDIGKSVVNSKIAGAAANFVLADYMADKAEKMAREQAELAASANVPFQSPNDALNSSVFLPGLSGAGSTGVLSAPKTNAALDISAWIIGAVFLIAIFLFARK